MRNPIFTSVLYLARNTASASSTSSSINKDAPDAPDAAALNSIPAEQQQAQQHFVGGPTLVTDQLLGGPLATKGWLAYPATNRFVMFDGKYLHGETLHHPATAAVSFENFHLQCNGSIAVNRLAIELHWGALLDSTVVFLAAAEMQPC